MSKQREFEIHVYLDCSNDRNYKLADRLANVVFESSKDCVGCIFSEGGYSVHRVCGYGKHSDAVRVYSALRANKYTVVYCQGV